MEIASLYVHDCITKLYSLLNQFNQANGDYTQCLNLLSTQLNSLKGFAVKNEVDSNQSMDDIIICLNFWLDQLFIQENNDSKLILLLDVISKIITLNHILITKYQTNIEDIKNDYIKCLNKFLDLLVKIFDQHSKSTHIKQFLKTDLVGKLLAYINYYDKDMIIDEQNSLSMDLLLNNYLLRLVFLKEYNSVIKQRFNINTYKFIYTKYTSSDEREYTTYLNVDKDNETNEYKIHKIVNNKLLAIPTSKYSDILMKISDENCFLQYLYHIIDLGGFDEYIKNNDIINYYMNILVLSNFDYVLIRNLFKENTTNKPTIFMDMLTRQNKTQSSQREIYEKQIEAVDKTFLKKFLDMQVIYLINKQNTVTKKELHEQAKTLLDYTFGLFNVFDCDLISHSNGKIPLLFLVEFCFLPYIRKLYYINKEFMELIDWQFFLKIFTSLIQTHNFNNIGFAITEIFNMWAYAPLKVQDQFVNNIILKYWDETFSPENHGFLSNDILFCKLIVFKRIYLDYDKVLELLMKLQLKYVFNDDNDFLVLPHYRYLNLFKYPYLEKSKRYYELYDIDHAKYQVVKRDNKHVLNLNKELPSIKTPKGSGPLMNSTVSLNDKINPVPLDMDATLTTIDKFEKLDIGKKKPIEVDRSVEVLEDETNSSNYGISDFFPTNEYTSSITNFFSKKFFPVPEDEPQYDEITGNLDRETKELYETINFKVLPRFFYRFSYLDDLLLESISLNQDKFMDLSNDIKELVVKMGSFMNTSIEENEKALINKLNYSMNNILRIKLQKENELKMYNKQWKNKESSPAVTTTKLLKMKLPIEVESGMGGDVRNTTLSNVAMFIKIFNKTVEEHEKVMSFKDFFEEDSIMIVHDYTR